MPYLLVQNDITKMDVDAIVNAANNTLLGGGGVDGAIHAAAGPELYEECLTLNGCKTGEAKLTKGYRLPAKHIIHTVGPIYRDGTHGEEEILRKAYRSCLAIAEAEGFTSVAFPLISGGVYGYPKGEALRVASEELSAFSEAHEDVTLYMVLYNKRDFSFTDSDTESFSSRLRLSDADFAYSEHLPLMQTESAQVSEECECMMEPPARPVALYDALSSASKHAVDKEKKKAEKSAEKKKRKTKNGAAACFLQCKSPEADFLLEVSEKPYSGAALPKAPYGGASGNLSLNLDESFQKTLFRLIDERGMTDPECYKRANLDRRLFSKIRSNEDYRPSKSTACALAIALRLTLSETQDFLVKAGFVLSNSLVFDKIIMYCLEQKMYDYMKVNELLFYYDQPLLGA